MNTPDSTSLAGEQAQIPINKNICLLDRFKYYKAIAGKKISYLNMHKKLKK